MNKFRFKTEKEFEDTYGILWKEKVKAGWARDMVSYFNIDIPLDISDRIERDGMADFGRWAISMDMITLINPKDRFRDGVAVVKNGLYA